MIINEIGMELIRAWLTERMKNGHNLGNAEILAWARDAEFQLGEGNPPSIELRASESVSGRTETMTIPQEGIAK